MPKNIIEEKSFNFSILVLKNYMLLKSAKEFDLARQFMRSGTSVGANIQEAQGAESKKDFIHKLSIALKEAKECAYWIKLLSEIDLLQNSTQLLTECTEIQKILAKIILTSKSRM